MKITIKRFQDGKSFKEEFNISSLRVTTLLSALYEIKSKLDSTLTFSAGCKSGVCGACSVRVNSREVLACSYRVKDGDFIEPLNYHNLLRDLKVNKSTPHSKIEPIVKDIKSKDEPTLVTKEDEKRYRLQSDCILCDSCYSICPVFSVNPNFFGPFALLKAFRYLSDNRVKEETKGSILESIQDNGVWDCTLCGECSAICPQSIDPKGDILNLRSESLKAGYSDKSFTNSNFNFGFNPMGF